MLNSRLSTGVDAVGPGLVPRCSSPYIFLLPLPLWACGADSEESGTRVRRPTLPTGCSPDRGTPARHEAGVSAPLCVRSRRQRRVRASSRRVGTDQGRLPAPFAGHKRTEGGHTPSQTRGSGGIQSEGFWRPRGADSGGSPALCPDGSPHPTLSSPLAAQPPQCPKEGRHWKRAKLKIETLQPQTFGVCLFPTTQKGDRYTRGSETWQGCGGRALILPQV